MRGQENSEGRQQKAPVWFGPLAVWLAFGGAAACGVHGAPLGSASGSAGSSTSDLAGATGTSGGGGSGPPGSAGASGSSGVAGGAGVGAAGTTGTAGASGSAGGITGTTGVAGTNGAAGSVGSTGGTGTGASSGVTVDIGGTNVAKENVIAFINFGHSNMAGRGVDPPETRPFFFDAPDPHAWMYHSGRGFEPAVEPNTATDGGNKVNGMVSGGPSTALVKEAAALAPSKYFVTIPFGQSSAYCSQFLPGALYYEKLIAGVKELKGKVTFAAIFIYLGITERHGTQADIDNYPQCIKQLVTAVRADAGEPNLPLFINDYEMGTTGPLAPGCAFYNAFHPKQLSLPSVVPNSFLIPTDNPIVQIQDDHSTTDDHHFSLDGHKEYVRRVLQTMKDKGLFPWQ
jgi:hypothetical protein